MQGADALAAGEQVETTLYKNGGSSGKKLTLNEDSFKKLLASKGRLYNGKGELLTSLAQAKNESRIYSGPENPGAHFQWPSVGVIALL